MVTSKAYWDLSREREWLHLALTHQVTRIEKLHLLRGYLKSIAQRAVSFDGEHYMHDDERQAMETTVLSKMFDLEHNQERSAV